LAQRLVRVALRAEDHRSAVVEEPHPLPVRGERQPQAVAADVGGQVLVVLTDVVQHLFPGEAALAQALEEGMLVEGLEQVRVPTPTVGGETGLTGGNRKHAHRSSARANEIRFNGFGPRPVSVPHGTPRVVTPVTLALTAGRGNGGSRGGGE